MGRRVEPAEASSSVVDPRWRARWLARAAAHRSPNAATRAAGDRALRKLWDRDLSDEHVASITAALEKQLATSGDTERAEAFLTHLLRARERWNTRTEGRPA